MDRIAVQDYQVLVLAEGETPSAVNNAKGHLFEKFIARMLHEFGFDAPRSRNVNVTSEGIELDVSVASSFTNSAAVAEGKAYSTNIRAQALTSFYGKLQMERFEEPDLHGYLFALPRLVAEGAEKAKAAEARDSRFHYLDAQRIVDHLIDRSLIRSAASVVPDGLIASDPTIIVAEEGLYSCIKVLNPQSRRADHILVWGRSPMNPVPDPVVKLLGQSDYGNDLPIVDIERSTPRPIGNRPPQELMPPVVVTVRGSSSDFEYQFPASPAFFVGRRGVVGELSKVLESRRGTFVLNAQSGWGKSSLALKLKTMTEEAGGYAIVIDSRTASSPLFVTEALRISAQRAAEAGLINLPNNSSWASLHSAATTLENATWNRSAPLVIFFDQFENVFQDEATTREFRDLALMIHELSSHVLIGFAWKTDLVGWTESHPYRLRDEIRAGSVQIIVDPMGAKDVEALLRRLEKRINQRLARDLRQRLREVSQGYPWLFKKLAEHVIREIEERGISQEQLVSEALNAQNLFDSDLAGLQPMEQDAVRHVARYAPVSAAEVTERYDGAIIQSLLDRRLLVAVGEKLDTYWDIFRDFLNTGRIPIEDSYTIGLSPLGVAPVLAYAVNSGGDVSVPDAATAVGASTGSIVNTARTLRLLGLTTYEANRVRVLDSIMESSDRESAVRRVVTRTLRRHKAHSLFLQLAERQTERASFTSFARELPQAFPAIEARPKTWAAYARAFALWFEYAGLAILRANDLYLPTDGYSGKGNLLTSKQVASVRVEHLHGAPGPSLRLLEKLSTAGVPYDGLDRATQRAARSLLLLDLLMESPKGTLVVAPDAVIEGRASPLAILDGLLKIPGGAEAIRMLREDPAVDIFSIGTVLRNASAAEWKNSTTELNGKHFRSWAKVAGVYLVRARGVVRDTEESALF